MKIRAHETFNIRKGWLRKGVKNILNHPRLFTDKEVNPCDILGIGTNMVKSLRYWMTAVGIMVEVNDGNQKVQKLTDVGNIINNNDPYFEEDGTNWILHYMLAKNEDLATSWFWFFNVFKITTFDKAIFVKELSDYLKTQYGYHASEKMLGDDFDCIVKTYFSKNKEASPEDIYDCPLTELHLIDMADNRSYRKRTPDKDMIHPLIVYAVICDQTSADEVLISDLLNKQCNIGRIFNLDRTTCFAFLEELERRNLLNVVRTAGLDVIRLTHKDNFNNVISAYYQEINGANIDE